MSHRLRPAMMVLSLLFPLFFGAVSAQTAPTPIQTTPLPAAQPAPVQPSPASPVPTPAPPAGAATSPSSGPLSRERLQAATYVILPPVVQGNASLIGSSDMQSVLGAMARDSQGAIHRRYPGAHFTDDANAPGVIRVTPQMLAPSALVPWANIGASWVFQAQGAPDLVLQQNFSLWTVYLHRAEAANFVFDQLAQRLP
ncbi:hypothetical protein GCM10022631_08220 [Deinococcus rubellus]|uniref:Serine protease n=1 Tax=Deinococcus rubellus TaxID=1889240 RepID=A0ABY5YNQ0_9DEIO|nr:hypothetical protein [Deinococcus rubellus]UWX65697.1 hypothetical protein N0D28_13900 [Deinococcus rubellus]